MKRFTARRMRSGFGNGLSIPSQMRWVGYVDWWAKHGKVYVEREVEILEIHVHGLRDGVKVSVEGYVEEGKVIKTFHTFTKEERILMDVPSKHDQSTSIGSNTLDEKTCPPHESNSEAESITTNTPSTTTESTIQDSNTTAALFRPATPITLPSSDVNIAFERRNAAIYGFTMVTSVAHVWFNIFFESQYATSTSSQTQKASPTTTDNPTPTDPSTLPTSGVFSIPWEDMDGIRGSPRKGARALDRLSVVWRCPSNPNPRTSNAPSQPPTTLESAHSIAASSPQPTNAPGKIIPQPPPGAQIPEAHPADWRQPRSSQPASWGDKKLGLRAESPSGGVSKANSTTDMAGLATTSNKSGDDSDSEPAGVKAHGPDGEEFIPHPEDEIEAPEQGGGESGSAAGVAETVKEVKDVGVGKAAELVEDMETFSVKDSVPERWIGCSRGWFAEIPLHILTSKLQWHRQKTMENSYIPHTHIQK